jgi:hypothetical protein
MGQFQKVAGRGSESMLRSESTPTVWKVKLKSLRGDFRSFAHRRWLRQGVGVEAADVFARPNEPFGFCGES